MKPLTRRSWHQVTATLLGSAAFASREATAQQSSQPRIKVGQIGVGHAHASKLAVYRRSTDYEVVGICEPNAELRKQAESEAVYRDLPWMTADELLSVRGLQAVLVETEVRDLLATAEACLAAGMHVHLDKPAGNSLPHYRKVLDLAAGKNLLVQMGYMYRYNPGFLLLKEFLKQGWLGEIFELHTVMSKVVPPQQRKELAEFPGGIMFELGCHVIDLVIGILGEPEKITPFPSQVLTDDPLKDNMLAVFRYPKALATVKSSAVEVDGGNRRQLVVCGTQGTFQIQPLDNPEARITLDRPRGEYAKGQQVVKFPKFERYVADAADMAKIIRGEKPTDYSYRHDWLVQQSLLRACGVSE